MRSSIPVLVINVLIVVALVVGVLSIGLIGLTAVQVASHLTVGSVTSTTSGTVTTISVPVTISNAGYLPISDLTIAAAVTDQSGAQLLTGSTGPVTVPAGESQDVLVQLTLDTSKVPQSELTNLVTANQTLNVAVTASTSVPPFVSLSADVTASLEWGAPVSGLALGTPTFQPQQGSISSPSVSVPVAFQNTNTFLTVSGQGTVTVYDQQGNEVGTGSLNLDVPPGGSFQTDVAVSLQLPQSEVQGLLFNDTTLTYSAVVSISSNGATYNQTVPISYQWGAPMADLKLGALAVGSVGPANATFTVPMSFTDDSATLDVSGTVSGVVLDQGGNQVGTIDQASIGAGPGGTFSGSLSGSILTSAASQTSFTLRLTFDTAYGSATVEVPVGA